MLSLYIEEAVFSRDKLTALTQSLCPSSKPSLANIEASRWGEDAATRIADTGNRKLSATRGGLASAQYYTTGSHLTATQAHAQI